jgi:hypothetical protein
MAVAGEAEVEGQRGQVLRIAQQIERKGEPQLQLVAVERQAFDLLEDLGQVARRDADLGQGPAPAEVRRQ